MSYFYNIMRIKDCFVRNCGHAVIIASSQKAAVCSMVQCLVVNECIFSLIDCIVHRFQFTLVI